MRPYFVLSFKHANMISINPMANIWTGVMGRGRGGNKKSDYRPYDPDLSLLGSCAKGIYSIYFPALQPFSMHSILSIFS